MRSRTLLSLVVILAGIIAPLVARAQLVLNFDPAVKKLWFTGSTAGTTDGLGHLDWFAGSTYNPSGELSVDPAAMFFISTPTIITSFLAFSGGSGTLGELYFTFGSPTAFTLTGTGPANFYDYSGASLNAQTLLESTYASLPFYTGNGATGAAAITITQSVYSAVPEPSTYAALAGLGALVFVGLRRRPRTA